MVPAAKLPAVPERDATLDAFVSEPSDDDEVRVEERREDDDDEENDQVVVDDGDETERDDDQTTPTQPEADNDQTTPTETRVGDEQAVTTFSWSPEGAVCESCGESSARRWRTDTGLVCPACVDWERTPDQ